MRFGIISDSPQRDEDSGAEAVGLMLIDYEDRKLGERATKLTLLYVRKSGKDWHLRSVDTDEMAVHEVGKAGKMLAALDNVRQKHGDSALEDPANLLHFIQKQLARHVVLDGDEYVLAKQFDGHEDAWQGPGDVSVRAASEEDAKKKIIRRLGDLAAAGDAGAAKSLADWLGSGSSVVRTRDAAPDFAPLTVYSRRSASAKKTPQPA